MRLLPLFLVVVLAAPAFAKAPQGPAAPQAPPVKADLCPCSAAGVCDCSERSNCGCLDSTQYRWVATSRQGHTALYQGRKQLGNWRQEEGAFYLLRINPDDSNTWTAGACPVPAPAAAQAGRSGRQMTVTLPRAYTPTYAMPQAFGGFRGGACSGGG